MEHAAYPPISPDALLSDCHSAALVSRDGSVDWCCLHRFDAARGSPACSTGPTEGTFGSPTDPSRASRRYLPDTNVLKTRFTTPDGVVVITDCPGVRKQHRPAAVDEQREAGLVVATGWLRQWLAGRLAAFGEGRPRPVG